jgi:hypothetical protein
MSEVVEIIVFVIIPIYFYLWPITVPATIYVIYRIYKHVEKKEAVKKSLKEEQEALELAKLYDDFRKMFTEEGVRERKKEGEYIRQKYLEWNKK